MSSKKTRTNKKDPSTPKTPRTRKPKAQSADGKLSILDAAAKVLKDSDGGNAPMNCKAMVEKMLSSGYWKTNGKTPAATLSSAIEREIKVKGKDSRFKKVERGQFVLA